jgi:hypothetical protein
VNADPRRREGHPPASGPVVATALTLGFVLMAIQLWILTVALDLLLGGATRGFLRLVLASGAVFAGGILVLRLLGPPRQREA